MSQSLKSRALKELANVSEPLRPRLASFYQNRLSELAEMKMNCERHDWEAIRFVAHNWKGFCAPYGFSPLGSMAKDLEQEIMQSDRSPSEERVQKHLQEMQNYLDALDGFDFELFCT